VAEGDPAVAAQRVLEACAAEVDSVARALYLLEAGQEPHVRVAVEGDASQVPEQLSVRETHLAQRQGGVVGHVGLRGAHPPRLGRHAHRRRGAQAPHVAALADGDLRAARGGRPAGQRLAHGGAAHRRHRPRRHQGPGDGAYTFAYFGDIAAREIERAVRHHREFALLTLHMPGVEPLTARLTQGDLGTLRRAVTQGVLAAVRDSDVVARVDDGEYYLLLPETGLLGALACRRRILERLKRLPQDLESTASGWRRASR
jgi:hypothetical protein